MTGWPAAAQGPPYPSSPNTWPTAPRLGWLIVFVAAVFALVSFIVGVPSHAHYESFGDQSECGSVFMPNFVSDFDVGDCDETLAQPRLAVILLAAGAAGVARLGAAKSGSVGRMHTRAWEATLVVGVVGVFLFLWTLLAWGLAHVGAYEGS